MANVLIPQGFYDHLLEERNTAMKLRKEIRERNRMLSEALQGMKANPSKEKNVFLLEYCQEQVEALDSLLASIPFKPFG